MYTQASEAQINAIPETHIQMKIATTEKEKNQIYQFRYKIFVEEMTTPVHAADHKRKMIIDDLDKHSTLIYALIGSKIIATSRVTIGDIDQFPDWLASIFSLNKFKDMLHDYPNRNIGLTTKMAIDPAYRGSTVMFRLIAEMYKIYNDHQIQFSFGGGNPRLIQLYERVGYRRFTRNFTEPGYGLLIPIVFIHDDIDHLKAVRSPLFRLFPKTKNPVLLNRFYESFPDATKHINSQLKDSSLTFIQKILQNQMTYQSPFCQFTQEERNLLIQLGAIIHCTKDDVITTVGEMSSELYFLLSGSLSVHSPHRSQILQPGQAFGHISSNPAPYSVQITAQTEADLLIIPDTSFQKFVHLYPEKALNLEQTILL